MEAEVRNELIKLANTTLDEVCGFIVAGRVHQMRNVAREPRATFNMDPDELQEFLEAYWDDAEGIFHSHPSGTEHPSEMDIEYSIPQGLRYYIVTPTNVIEWRIENGEAHRVAG